MSARDKLLLLLKKIYTWVIDVLWPLISSYIQDAIDYWTNIWCMGVEAWQRPQDSLLIFLNDTKDMNSALMFMCLVSLTYLLNLFKYKFPLLVRFISGVFQVILICSATHFNPLDSNLWVQVNMNRIKIYWEKLNIEFWYNYITENLQPALNVSNDMSKWKNFRIYRKIAETPFTKLDEESLNFMSKYHEFYYISSSCLIMIFVFKIFFIFWFFKEFWRSYFYCKKVFFKDLINPRKNFSEFIFAIFFSLLFMYHNLFYKILLKLIRKSGWERPFYRRGRGYEFVIEEYFRQERRKIYTGSNPKFSRWERIKIFFGCCIFFFLILEKVIIKVINFYAEFHNELLKLFSILDYLHLKFFWKTFFSLWTTLSAFHWSLPLFFLFFFLVLLKKLIKKSYSPFDSFFIKQKDWDIVKEDEKKRKFLKKVLWKETSVFYQFRRYLCSRFKLIFLKWKLKRIRWRHDEKMLREQIEQQILELENLTFSDFFKRCGEAQEKLKLLSKDPEKVIKKSKTKGDFVPPLRHLKRWNWFYKFLGFFLLILILILLFIYTITWL